MIVLRALAAALSQQRRIKREKYADSLFLAARTLSASIAMVDVKGESAPYKGFHPDSTFHPERAGERGPH